MVCVWGRGQFIQSPNHRSKILCIILTHTHTHTPVKSNWLFCIYADLFLYSHYSNYPVYQLKRPGHLLEIFTKQAWHLCGREGTAVAKAQKGVYVIRWGKSARTFCIMVCYSHCTLGLIAVPRYTEEGSRFRFQYCWWSWLTG